jgi:DNA-binding LytR/AlgR family response regulator
MNNKFQAFILTIRDKFFPYLSISLGMFLFILFFQPFPNVFTDLDNVLVFNAGFGAITFILLYFIQLFSKAFRQDDKELMSYFNGFVLLILSSVAYTFYLRYAGHTAVGFYTTAKIIIVCLAPPVALRLYQVVYELRLENTLLSRENDALQQQFHMITDKILSDTVEFYSSEGLSESLKLNVSDIALVKSADNYVEIYFREKNIIRKKLVRNTLRNIEQLLRPYSQFIRCHRTCIINSDQIERLQLKINSSFIVVKDLNESIPVSRQYIFKLKEAIEKAQR